MSVFMCDFYLFVVNYLESNKSWAVDTGGFVQQNMVPLSGNPWYLH